MGTGPRPAVRMRRLPQTLLDRDAMLSIGGHMLSAWDIGVERGGGEGVPWWRVALAQPLRAETGHATLRYLQGPHGPNLQPTASDPWLRLYARARLRRSAWLSRPRDHSVRTRLPGFPPHAVTWKPDLSLAVAEAPSGSAQSPPVDCRRFATASGSRAGIAPAGRGARSPLRRTLSLSRAHASDPRSPCA